MASLSTEDIEFAKSRAKAHLSRSILTTALSLGLDVDSLSSPFEITVEQSDPLYHSYLSLANQLEALSKL